MGTDGEGASARARDPSDHKPYPPTHDLPPSESGGRISREILECVSHHLSGHGLDRDFHARCLGRVRRSRRGTDSGVDRMIASFDDFSAPLRREIFKRADVAIGHHVAGETECKSRRKAFREGCIFTRYGHIVESHTEKRTARNGVGTNTGGFFSSTLTVTECSMGPHTRRYLYWSRKAESTSRRMPHPAIHSTREPSTPKTVL